MQKRKTYELSNWPKGMYSVSWLDISPKTLIMNRCIFYVRIKTFSPSLNNEKLLTKTKQKNTRCLRFFSQSTQFLGDIQIFMSHLPWSYFDYMRLKKSKTLVYIQLILYQNCFRPQRLFSWQFNSLFKNMRAIRINHKIKFFTFKNV